MRVTFLRTPAQRSFATACGSRWPAPWMVAITVALVLVAIYAALSRYIIRVAPGASDLVVERSRIPFPPRVLHTLALARQLGVEIEQKRGRKAMVSRLVFVMDDETRTPLTTSFSNMGSDRAATVAAIHRAISSATGRYLPSPPVASSVASALPFWVFAGAGLTLAIGSVLFVGMSRSSTQPIAGATRAPTAAAASAPSVSSSAHAKPVPSSCHCDAGDMDCMIGCVVMDPQPEGR